MILPVTTTVNNEELAVFYKHNVKECNIHLLTDDLEMKNIKHTLQRLRNFPFKVVSFHTPAFDRDTYFCIEHICIDHRMGDALKKIEYLCQELNICVPVVVHSSLEKEFLYQAERIAYSTDMVLSECPHIILCLENNINFPQLGHDFKEIPLMVPNLISAMNERMVSNVYSCLDICHANIIHQLCALFHANGVNDCEVPTVDDYINAFAPSCRLIHLANTGSWGVKTGHGIGFNGAEVNKLRNLLIKLTDKMPKAKVVLEVSESDYVNRPNVDMTLKTLSGLEV